MPKTKQYEQWFPLGLADGKAFIGRQTETKLLMRNIESNRHTLLLSPRKYGKTSLVKHVLRKSNYIATDIDLFLAIDQQSIFHKLLKACHIILKQACSQPEQWIKALSNYFQKANKEWTVGIKGLQLQLIPASYNDFAENILETLNAVEFLLKKKQQKAILFIDEFQDIARLDENKAIQGAIRHFAQSSKYLMLIFSGSNRHLLELIFNDDRQPLYDLCERIKLERIDESDYQAYLNKVSLESFQQPLDEQAFATIMNLSDRHPKVVYILCKKIWDYCFAHDCLPTKDKAELVWSEYIELTHKDTRNTLSVLSSNQLAILRLIANGENSGLTGKKYTAILNVTSGAISQALETLEKKDFLEQLKNSKYRVIDPVIRDTLLRYSE